MAHPGGRPTELTPKVLADIALILPTCLYLETVADYIGVSRTQVRKWIKRSTQELKRIEKGEKPDPKEAIYVEFRYTYKKALAEGEIGDLGTIKKAAADQWQAAAWRLERRFPHKWGRDRALLMQLAKDIQEMKHANPGGINAPGKAVANGAANGKH